MYFFCSIFHPTVMMRASAINDVRYSDESGCLHCEDYDLWLRLLGRGCKLANIKDVGLLLRRHSSSVSAKFAKMQRFNSYGRVAIHLSNFLAGVLKHHDSISHAAVTGVSKQSTTFLETKAMPTGLPEVALKLIASMSTGQNCDDDQTLKLGDDCAEKISWTSIRALQRCADACAAEELSGATRLIDMLEMSFKKFCDDAEIGIVMKDANNRRAELGVMAMTKFIGSGASNESTSAWLNQPGALDHLRALCK
jgi:hypothetical protein